MSREPGKNGLLTKMRETIWMIRLMGTNGEPGLPIVVSAANAVQAIAKAEVELGLAYALPVHSIEVLVYRGYLVTDKTGVLFDRDLCGGYGTLDLVKEIVDHGTR